MPSWSTQLYSLLRIKYSNAPFLALFCLRFVVEKEMEEKALYFHTNSKLASTAMKNAPDILIRIDCVDCFVSYGYF